MCFHLTHAPTMIHLAYSRKTFSNGMNHVSSRVLPPLSGGFDVQIRGPGRSGRSTFQNASTIHTTDSMGWSQWNLNTFLSENISENKIRYSSGWSIRFNRLWKIEKIKNNRSAGRHIRYICCDREENQCKEMFWWIKENHYRASVSFMIIMINYFS